MTDSDLALLGFRQMVKSPLQGGSIHYANGDYDCTVGTFEIQEVLVNGGFSPMLLGDVQVAREDLPDGNEFKAGQLVAVTSKAGMTRNCQVRSFKDSGILISLILWDANQSA